MLAILREGSDEEAADRAVDLIQRGIAPQSIWDAAMCGASEVLMRNPGIVPLHTVTTTNAIRYLYERSQSDETRRWLLLQSASFVPFLRGGARPGARVDELTAVEPSTPGDQAITEIFSAVSSDKPAAARKVLGYLSRTGNAKALLHAANRLIFLKGNDSHDYKFSAAVLEDFTHLSPMWRERYLAASVFWLNGSGAPDNELVERARQALAG
jgi:hypothetical protein